MADNIPPIGDPRRLAPGPCGGTVLFSCGGGAPGEEAQLRALGLCGEAVWLDLPSTGLPAPRGRARTWYDARR